MTAIRPRSFKSKLQLGLSVFFHRRFGSKRFIQIFSSFGLCASNNDTMLYEAAAVLHHPPSYLQPEISTFFQYVAENADINVHIVDSSCKKPLVICNSIFSIFLNQIKAQRNQKIMVWIEYFPYKYSFKVISND
jgi:hypothetical protein